MSQLKVLALLLGTTVEHILGSDPKGIGPIEELANLPEEKIQIKLLRRSNLSELSNVLDSWRPTIVYISSGLTTMQRAGLEKRNLEPLDIISTEAGKESLMTLLSTLSPEAVYFDASGCHAIDDDLHQAGIKHIISWSIANPPTAFSSMHFARSFFSSLAHLAISIPEAFSLATHLTMTYCSEIVHSPQQATTPPPSGAGASATPVMIRPNFPRLISKESLILPGDINKPALSHTTDSNRMMSSRASNSRTGHPTQTLLETLPESPTYKDVIALYPSYALLSLCSLQAEMRMLATAQHSVLNIHAMSYLCRALRGIVAAEVRSLILEDVSPWSINPAFGSAADYSEPMHSNPGSADVGGEKFSSSTTTPSHHASHHVPHGPSTSTAAAAATPPHLLPCLCRVRTVSGIALSVVLNVPDDIMETLALLEFGLRQTLTADAHGIQVKLPVNSIPSHGSRGGSVGAGGVPVTEMLFTAPLWITGLLKTMCEHGCGRILVSAGICAVSLSRVKPFLQGDAKRFSAIAEAFAHHSTPPPLPPLPPLLPTTDTTLAAVKATAATAVVGSTTAAPSNPPLIPTSTTSTVIAQHHTSMVTTGVPQVTPHHLTGILPQSPHAVSPASAATTLVRPLLYPAGQGQGQGQSTAMAALSNAQLMKLQQQQQQYHALAMHQGKALHGQKPMVIQAKPAPLMTITAKPVQGAPVAAHNPNLNPRVLTIRSKPAAAALGSGQPYNNETMHRAT